MHLHRIYCDVTFRRQYMPIFYLLYILLSTRYIDKLEWYNYLKGWQLFNNNYILSKDLIRIQKSKINVPYFTVKLLFHNVFAKNFPQVLFKLILKVTENSNNVIDIFFYISNMRLIFHLRNLGFYLLMDDMVTRIGIIVKDETFNFNLLKEMFWNCLFCNNVTLNNMHLNVIITFFLYFIF